MADILFKLASRIPVLRQIQQVYAKANALEQLYDHANIAQGLIPTKYYQQVEAGSGNVKGYSAVCLCGKEHRILSLFECFAQDLMCPTCRMEINLLKFIGAVDASGKVLVKSQDLRALLAKLPVRPVGVGAAATRYLPSDNGDAGFVAGSRGDARERGFASGDPNYSGLF